MFAKLMGRRSTRKASRPERNGIVAGTPIAKELGVTSLQGMDITTAPVDPVDVTLKDEIPNKNVFSAEVSQDNPAAINHEPEKELPKEPEKELSKEPEQMLCVAETPQINENKYADTECNNQSIVAVHRIGNLPLLRDVPLYDRQDLLIKKLNLCSLLYDFSNPKDSIAEKEIKRQTLMELLDYIQFGGHKLTERVQGEITKMFAANLFRSFPPASYEGTGHEKLDREEEDSCMDPSWPHLQIVYELLLRYIMSSDTEPRLAKRYIDRFFVQRLLDIFDSEDPREREYAKTILHRIYGKYMMHRPFIRRAIGNIFYRFIYETEKHNGISELLEILGSIINGFALPLKEEHKLFLAKILMPLHKPKCLALYHQQLAYCITQYIEKDVTLVDTAIKGLLKYWPVTNSQKEVMFLGELEEILEITRSPEFQCCMVPLFRQIGRCLNCTHFQVAERALFFWSNDHIANLIAENRHVILPLIFEALEKNSAHHWHRAVHGLTMNVKQMFLEMDENLFKECQLKLQEDEIKARESMQKREAIWRTLEDVANSYDHNGKRLVTIQN
eukprot:TRINITY_DN21627_c0_g1_i1.p1 TRINITY_DN21627_c0_g1~~TRINITY_DN21627_c0_g1_i1.p1  ORF type:complete len:559 (-),score=89.40 TRINITY_DN21627_c0_g1_i1:273-1949(-)